MAATTTLIRDHPAPTQPSDRLSELAEALYELGDAVVDGDPVRLCEATRAAMGRLVAAARGDTKVLSRPFADISFTLMQEAALAVRRQPYRRNILYRLDVLRTHLPEWLPGWTEPPPA